MTIEIMDGSENGNRWGWYRGGLTGKEEGDQNSQMGHMNQ